MERFVCVFVEAFSPCNDTANKLKIECIRAIGFEKELATLRFDQKSKLYHAWKQLAGDCVCTSTVIYQHFWSWLVLQGRTGQSVDEEHHSVNLDCGKENCDDEPEREAIRHHAGWAVKRARDVINFGSTIVSLKQSKDRISPAIQVTKKCLLSFFQNFGVDQRQNSRKYPGVLSGENEVASIIILQRLVSIFLKSKQQVIREQLNLKPQKQSKSLRQSLCSGKKGD